MAEWRVGRKLGVTLYRDEVFVGHVNGPEIAAEIVEAMEVRERVRDRAARNAEERSSESGRERSPEPGVYEHPMPAQAATGVKRWCTFCGTGPCDGYLGNPCERGNPHERPPT